MTIKTALFSILMTMSIVLLDGCYQNQPKAIDTNKYDLDIRPESNASAPETVVIGGESNTSETGQRSEKPAKIRPVETVPTFVQPGHLPKRINANENLPLKNPDRQVSISVQEIPIGKFIHLVFGQILQVNYTVDEKVEKRKDRVTLRMEHRITVLKLFAMVQSLLGNYGIGVTFKDGIYFIKNSPRGQTPAYDAKISFGKHLQFTDLPDNEVIYQIVPIDYLPLPKARSLVFQFAASKKIGRVYTVDYLNALMIKDYVKNVRKAVELLRIFDKPYMRRKSFELVHLEHIDVDKFDKRIRQIFSAMNIPVSTSARGEAVTLLPIREINSVLVITDKPAIIKTVLYWKSKLDNFEELEDKKQLFVYKTKNREAEEIKKILDQILAFNTKKTTVTAAKKPGNKNPGLKTTVKVAGVKTESALPKEAQVTVDKERNKLIFYMKPSGYKQIYEVLKQIDTKPRQILLEVTIAEVTLTDKLQYGVEWYLQNNSDKWGWTLGTLDGLGVGSGGITGTIVKYGSFQAVLNAFAQDNILHILSTPKLVVLNNKSASFNVGTQVPVITSQSTAPDLTTPGNQPSILQNVSYTTTGVITNIQPTITADNTIILKINQTVSEAQTNNTSDISSPIIINRSLSTEVILRDGQELILGGLIKDNKSRTKTKVPLIGDIPVVGTLFSTNSNTTDRTELLFIVRPHILGNQKAADAALNAFKKLSDYL